MALKENINSIRAFNKLVRDNIPQIIEDNNEEAIIRVLDDSEYKVELLKKLKEECEEVINAKNTNEILEELADVYEVMSSLAKLENIEMQDIINTSNKKRDIRGGFDKKIYLIETRKNIGK